MNRRTILKLGGAMAFGPITNVYAATRSMSEPTNQASEILEVNLTSDGRELSAHQYVDLLQELLQRTKGVQDRYGYGGAVEELEAEIAKITGKESAVFMPSGTMANQLAIKVLSKNKSKVFVQEQSHIYRDESDAAQLIHGKRLMPLAPGKANFTLDELNEGIQQYRKNEVFETGVGAISIENTVRRQDEEIFDFGEIKKISEFARNRGIGMHLDGARLYMASTWSGTSIQEYSSQFDTVYISLYKYLGAASGAVLAGDKEVVNRVRMWMKPYGAVMRQNWQNAMVALHFLDGFDDRLRKAKLQSEDLFSRLNEIDGRYFRTGEQHVHTCFGSCGRSKVCDLDQRKTSYFTSRSTRPQKYIVEDQ